MSHFGPSPTKRLLAAVPQASSIRAEVAGPVGLVEHGVVQQRQDTLERTAHRGHLNSVEVWYTREYVGAFAPSKGVGLAAFRRPRPVLGEHAGCRPIRAKLPHVTLTNLYLSGHYLL